MVNKRGLYIGLGNAITIGQHVEAFGRGNIQQQSPRDNGRYGLRTCFCPAPIAQVCLGVEIVPDLAIQSKVVQRIDVGAGVAVHRECGAGVAAGEVHGLAHAHRVVHHRAARGVGHPELVVRVAGILPAGHADVVFGGQVIGFAAADP